MPKMLRSEVQASLPGHPPSRPSRREDENEPGHDHPFVKSPENMTQSHTICAGDPTSQNTTARAGMTRVSYTLTELLK